MSETSSHQIRIRGKNKNSIIKKKEKAPGVYRKTIKNEAENDKTTARKAKLWIFSCSHNIILEDDFLVLMTHFPHPPLVLDTRVGLVISTHRMEC